MKVLILHNDLRVYWRGRLIYLRKFLASKGVELYAVELFGKGSPYDFDPFNKTEQWWDCMFPDNSNTELSKHQIRDKLFAKLDEIQPDIVIAGSIVFYSGALGLRWAKDNRKKFVMFDDAKPSWVKRNFLVQTIKNIITKQIDALWLPSKEYDVEYTKLYSKKLVHYFYGYNCIDNSHFSTEGEKSVDNKKIITVGRLVPKKNIQRLLAAWKFVEENNDTYSLQILGNGPLMQELRDYATTHKLKRVDFVGSVDNNSIPQYLSNADAFISPSEYESWGLVVNEAMAAGLPVLLSDKINAAPTLLKDGINGYLFNPYNIIEMQEKMLRFINLPVTEKKEMSDNSLRIINTISYKNMGDNLLDTINYLSAAPFKKPGLIARTILKLWHGRYNTSEWDKVSA